MPTALKTLPRCSFMTGGLSSEWSNFHSSAATREAPLDDTLPGFVESSTPSQTATAFLPHWSLLRTVFWGKKVYFTTIGRQPENINQVIIQLLNLISLHK